jgi:hypothetical protein
MKCPCDTQAQNLPCLSVTGVSARAPAATANSPAETMMNLWFRLGRAVFTTMTILINGTSAMDQNRSRNLNFHRQDMARSMPYSLRVVAEWPRLLRNTTDTYG